MNLEYHSSPVSTVLSLSALVEVEVEISLAVLVSPRLPPVVSALLGLSAAALGPSEQVAWAAWWILALFAVQEVEAVHPFAAGGSSSVRGDKQPFSELVGTIP